MEAQAEEHFNKKEYVEAMTIWMAILNIDPDNDRVQKRIELVFEIRQKKLLLLENSKNDIQNARKMLGNDSKLKIGIKKGKSAIRNFIAAYRLDPNDPGMKQMVDDMKELEADIKAAEEKERVAYALREKAKNFKLKAIAEMSSENPRYDVALGYWKEVLNIFENDVEAKEGVRKCEIAINNIIKFENIRKFTREGEKLLSEKNYEAARAQFQQVLILDPKNREAKLKISEIDDELTAIRNRKQRLIDAENNYLSAEKKIAAGDFDGAKDDFESALELVENYKDTKERIKSLTRLRAEYMRQQEIKRQEEINRRFQIGILAFTKGNYAAAIQAFEQTLLIDPKNSLAIDYLAKARQAMLTIEGETVEKDSQYYDIVKSLTVSGIKLYDNHEYKESLKRWERIMSLFPKNLVAREYMMRCNLKLNPDLFKILAEETVKQGKENLAKKEYDQAYKNFEMIRSINPEYPEIDKLIALSKTGKAKTAVALTPADRADIERRYRLGVALFQKGGKGNFEQARAQFAYVVKKDPGHVQAVIALNRVDSQLRGGGQPVEVARKKNLTPEQERLVKKHYYLGINYYSNNDYNNAIAEWRKVLAIDPTHVQSKNNIRKCLALLGR